MKLELVSSDGLVVYDSDTHTAILHNHPKHEPITDEKQLAFYKFVADNPRHMGANHYCVARKEWFLTDHCEHCGFKPTA